MKKCKVCKLEKDESEFHAHSEGKLHPWCKVCRRAKEKTRHHQNKDSANLRRRENHSANRKSRVAGMKEYYQANKLRALERNRKWREENRLAAQAQWNRRRSRERGAKGECTNRQWLDRWAQFGGMCWQCGKPATEMDHLIPLAIRPLAWPSNLRPSCRACNASKGSKPLARKVSAPDRPRRRVPLVSGAA